MDIVPLVAVILSAGAGAFFREIISGVGEIIGGMSARESKRKVDIVQQRDAVLLRESSAMAERDEEADKRRAEQEYSARLQGQLIENGIEPGVAPVHESTITRKQLTELQDNEKQ